MAADIVRHLNSPIPFDCTNEKGTKRRQKRGEGGEALIDAISLGRIRQFGLSQIRGHSSEEEPDWKWNKGRETVSRCSWRHSVSSLFLSVSLFLFLLYRETKLWSRSRLRSATMAIFPFPPPSSIVGPLDYITPNAAGFLPLYAVYTNVTLRVVCSLFTSPDDVIWPETSPGFIGASASVYYRVHSLRWNIVKYRLEPTTVSQFFQRFFLYQGLLLLRIIRVECSRQRIIRFHFQNWNDWTTLYRSAIVS